jgi:macrodomain Ter protein organizer (MatP/YcbG family)
MRPNYKKMTDAELRAYIKENRTDEEAIQELFVHRRSPDESATWYSAPFSPEGIEQTQELIRQKMQS